MLIVDGREPAEKVPGGGVRNGFGNAWAGGPPLPLPLLLPEPEPDPLPEPEAVPDPPLPVLDGEVSPGLKYSLDPFGST